mgnify:CR=1 FL=1
MGRLERYNWLLEQARLKKLLEDELESYKKFYELAEAHLSEDDFAMLIERWNEQ